MLIDKDGNAKTLSLKKVGEDFFLDEQLIRRAIASIVYSRLLRNASTSFCGIVLKTKSSDDNSGNISRAVIQAPVKE